MTLPFEVGVVVRDLASMERFYCEVIGCRPERRSRVPESVGGPAGLGGELEVVWLGVPSGGRVKLIRPRSAPVEVPAAAWSAGRPGLSYLTFHVDDTDPVVARLTAAGARPSRTPSWYPRTAAGISFWADPEGNVVELVDRRGGRPRQGHSN
ncbi:VOC domain-containing protein OS=Streptomyces griseorubiginosus OX=67304 GN=AQJ54_19575 PE=4 SV=1 [Streptomyces griseorubiginosus]